jgi:hypothetical protein
VAPLPDAAGVVKVTLFFTISGKQDILTRFFIHYDGTAPSNSDLNTFCGSIRTQFGTNLKSLLSAAYTLAQVQAVDLSSVTGAIGIDSTQVAGTRAGSVIPASASVVTSYTFARRYRGGHSRAYWPFGVQADMATSDVWGSTFQSSVKTGVDAFFSGVLGAGWSGAGSMTHVNVSYFHGSHVVVNPVTGRARNVPDLRATPLKDTITSVAVKLPIGSQRRRLRA